MGEEVDANDREKGPKTDGMVLVQLLITYSNVQQKSHWQMDIFLYEDLRGHIF